MEKVITQEGFEHLRDMLASAVSACEEAQKRAFIRSCVCGGRAKFKAADRRTVLSVIGHIAYPRRRYHCSSCKSGTSVPALELLPF